MRNNKKKLLRIILALSLCVCTVLGSVSFAFAGLLTNKQYTPSEDEVPTKGNISDIDFSKWNNKVNEDILPGDEFTFKNTEILNTDKQFQLPDEDDFATENGKRFKELIKRLESESNKNTTEQDSSGSGKDAEEQPLTESSGNTLTEASILNTKSFYGYMLVVSTGITGCDSVSKISLKYKADDGKTYTQLIDPAEKTASGVPGSISEILSGSDWLQGSRLSSYGPLYYRASGNSFTGIEKFYGKNSKYVRRYDLVSSWAKAITHSEDALSGYIPAEQITNPKASDMFRPFTCEYLLMYTRHRIASLEEINFILSGEKNCTWTMEGWKLFSVDFTKDPQHYIGPTLNTYSYLSDRIAMDFSGTLVAQSSDKELHQTGVKLTNGISNIRFTGKDKLGDDDFPIDYVGSGSFAVGSSYKSNSQTLNFKFNISTEQGSGLDSFVSYLPDCGIVIRDVLYAKIFYENDLGYQEEVTIPVISESLIEASMTEKEADFLNDAAFKSICGWKTITQYACDGSSILFSVDFPNFKKLNSVRLSYKNDVDEKDYFNIESVQVFDDNSYGQRAGYYINNNTYVSDSGNLTADPSMISMSLPSELNLLYVTDSANMIPGSSPELDFVESDELYIPSLEYRNKYLITIKTDDAKDVGTLDTVFVTFTYTDIYGNSKETDELSLVDLCNDFYGENKGIIGTPGNSYTSADAETAKSLKQAHSWINAALMTIVKPEKYSFSKIQCYGVDITYATHMAKGATMSFVVEIPELKNFTNVRFRIDNEDMWQLGYISIARLQSLGTRRRVNIGQHSILGISYLYDIERSANGITMYENDDVGLLITDGYKDLDLNSSTVFAKEETVRDYTQYYYAMTESKVMSNLHMHTVALTYEVTANVASNRSKATIDDGTGSNNLFYFQLQFEKGCSGFVLANSQLASDGFMAGESETFYISINEDLGNVTGIVILPDTISEESDQMDRLCLDSIKVVKRSGTINKCYNFNNINWIDLNYVDSASNQRKNGRSVSEIATIKKVSSVSYISDFEIALTYGAYKNAESDSETSEEAEEKQFIGDVTANIVYQNKSGERKVIKNFNVVNAMYSYDGRQPEYDSTANSGRMYISDPEWMFRGDTTDRFLVSIGDASIIQSITLFFNAEEGGDATIELKGVSISMVNSSGVTKINNNGEYQVVYEKEMTPIASDTSVALPYSMDTAMNVTKSHKIVFKNQNTVPSQEDAASGKTLITRVPESANDTVNLYIYLDRDAVSPDRGGYELSSTIGYYSAVSGRNLGSKVIYYDETTEDGAVVLSNVGIGTPNFTNLKSLCIKADSDVSGAAIDHAVIQHVRSGVVIETYYCTMFPQNAAAMGGSLLAYADSTSIKNRQLLTLVLDADSPAVTLSSEKRDIAACLVYRSNLGGVSGVYESENVFISDSGALRIGGGSVVNLEFNEDNVSDIIGVKLQAENGAECLVENGIVRCYRTDAGGEEAMVGYYSLNSKSSTHVGSAGAEISVSSSVNDSVNELRSAHFSFVTMDKGDTYLDGGSSSYAIDSNGAYPIRMTIGYVNERGQLKTKVIEDIRKLCGGASNFTQGQTAEFTTLIPGITRISYVQIEPKNNSNVASGQNKVAGAWNLKELSFSVDETDYKQPMTIPIYSQIKECVNKGETPKKYNLSNISVSVSVEHDGNVGYASNGIVTMSGKAGQSAAINVEVFGSLTEYGYTYKIEQSFGGGVSLVKPEQKESSKKLTVTLPENNTQFEMQYIVTVSSEESPSINSVIKFYIPVKEVDASIAKDAETQTESEEPGNSVNNTDNSVDKNEVTQTDSEETKDGE